MASTTKAVGGPDDPRYVAALAVAEPVLAAAELAALLDQPAHADVEDP